jgi:hypothetical protein
LKQRLRAAALESGAIGLYRYGQEFSFWIEKEEFLAVTAPPGLLSMANSKFAGEFRGFCLL